MSILKVQGHPNLVRDLKTQAIVNVDSDAYARYMARKAKQKAKSTYLCCRKHNYCVIMNKFF